MKKLTSRLIILIIIFLVNPLSVSAMSLDTGLAGTEGPENLTSTLQILVLMTMLTFLPSIVMMMTSFTRIIITLSLLRNGLGTQTTPPNQVLIGLTMFLTIFIMAPVVSEIRSEAIDPYLEAQLTDEEFLEAAASPIRTFMLRHTRSRDLELFFDMSGMDEVDSLDEIPLHIVVPAFIISELKTAFEISFLLLIPFIVIDFIVSSVLMSMGMMMLPPVMISLPFKILLFILVDGWHLVIRTLVQSFMG